MEQDNKMTPGNLGIVFGPTLLRPRPTDATVSLSSLVDYPHQARVIETLIVHYGLVFEEEPEEAAGSQVRECWWMGPLRLWGSDTKNAQRALGTYISVVELTSVQEALVLVQSPAPISQVAVWASHPSTQRWKEENMGFQASVSYRAGLKLAWAT